MGVSGWMILLVPAHLGSVLFFSRPRSEGWSHYGRTFSIYLCHSDWLFHGESCPRLDVVHPGPAWSSSPVCTWHCSLHYLFLLANCKWQMGGSVKITVATLSGNSLRQTVHTHCASVHQAAKFVTVLLRVAGVTEGLAKSNGSLPSGLWLTSPPGWLPRTGTSSGTLR